MSVPEKIMRNFNNNGSNGKKKSLFKTIFGILWKLAGIFALICLVGIHFIYVHDYLNQSSYFTTKEIEINGNRHLTEKDILEYGNIKKGMNLFSINNFILEKRLRNHPWIKDVSVTRKLPGKLVINVTEYREAAVIAFGKGYVIDEKGEPFKRFDVEDKLVLPVVKGLSKDDLLLGNSNIYKSVVNFLSLLKNDDFNKYEVTGIEADTELGLTVSSKKAGSIKLCFDDFISKFDRAAKILGFMESKNKKISTIDLCNINRVVVKQKLPADK